MEQLKTLKEAVLKDAPDRDKPLIEAAFSLLVTHFNNQRQIIELLEQIQYNTSK